MEARPGSDQAIEVAPVKEGDAPVPPLRLPPSARSDVVNAASVAVKGANGFERTLPKASRLVRLRLRRVRVVRGGAKVGPGGPAAFGFRNATAHPEKFSIPSLKPKPVF